MAEWVRKVKPKLEVEIIDLTEKHDADTGLVFAVPTYVHAGRPVFLGNPSPQQLQTWLDNLDLEV